MNKKDFLRVVRSYRDTWKKGRFRKEVEGKDCSFESLVMDSPDGHLLARGYFFWPSDEYPTRLGPAFVDSAGDSWAKLIITDESCNPRRPLKTIVELHEENKETARTSSYYYPNYKMLEGDKGEEYWDVDVDGDICRRSELTEEEIVTLKGLMTPIEKVVHEQAVAARTCVTKECNSFLMASVENPIKFYIGGSDDYTWTATGRLDESVPEDRIGPFSFDMFYFLGAPNWYFIGGDTRWYFSN